MKLIYLRTDSLAVGPDLVRTARSKQFEERLLSSIRTGGLAEPLKVTRTPQRDYLVVDGVLRLRAVQAIRADDPTQFKKIPAYLVPFELRYAVRYQSDIYQDLLPSQLARLVEHLHEHDHVSKTDIAQMIGVSPATLRNYTGLWRLVQREGLFAQIVDLMDLRIIPASNPYAWIRLTDRGLCEAIERHFSDGQAASAWISSAKTDLPVSAPYSIKFVEFATGHLPSDCYREDDLVRAKKRDLGLRRAGRASGHEPPDSTLALHRLRTIADESMSPVQRLAAASLGAFLS